LAVDRHAIAVIDVSWCFYYDDNDDGYYYVLLLLLLLSQSVQYYANKHRSIQECKFYHKRMQSRASCMMRDQSSNRHQATMSVAWHISDTHGYDHKEVYNSTAKYNKHYTHHAVVVMMVIRCSNASKQASKQRSVGLSSTWLEDWLVLFDQELHNATGFLRHQAQWICFSGLEQCWSKHNACSSRAEPQSEHAC
jgi:hypothetical protein